MINARLEIKKIVSIDFLLSNNNLEFYDRTFNFENI